jgi:7-carboxy-7-deazaguanine synthase
MPSLRITEIFCSLQGESSLVGFPTVFIRLTGCPLRCGYCDTAYAFKGGETRELESILRQVADYGVRHVTVTGGEPLAQKACPALLAALCDAGYRVSLETSGALDIGQVDTRVKRVMDIKTPSSGEQQQNLWGNIALLSAGDEVKFVIGDRADYDWSKEIIAEYGLAQRCGVLFSPVYAALEARTLADWIVEDRLPVRFQVQLHKLLWGDRPGV